jgi:hypothetical protein
VTVVLEGSRPMLVEVQALCSRIPEVRVRAGLGVCSGGGGGWVGGWGPRRPRKLAPGCYGTLPGLAAWRLPSSLHVSLSEAGSKAVGRLAALAAELILSALASPEHLPQT